MRRLSWVMITVSSISKNTGRCYHICYIPVNFVFNLPHYVSSYMHHTGKKESKKEIKKKKKRKNNKVTKNLHQGNSYPDP